MKKPLLIILSLIMIFSLCSCSSQEDKVDRALQGTWTLTIESAVRETVIIYTFDDGFFDKTSVCLLYTSLKADNIAPTAWVPNMHFVAPINDQFGWGASITSNYGLACLLYTSIADPLQILRNIFLQTKLGNQLWR